MITRKNRKNRTAYVYDTYGGVETFISQTLKGARQKNQLTVRDEFGNRVDLNGRQIDTLKRVLSTASRVAAHA